MENGIEVKTMILAGDIGGTKTLLGLFDAATTRPRPLAVQAFGTLDYPDLPTMNSMYPGFDVDNWYAMFMPAGTPKAIVDKLNAEILKALKSTDVQSYMANEGGQPVGSTPQELATMFQQEVTKYARVIGNAHIAAQ